jgi:ATP-dependent protease Clp ATPase subunit
MSRCAFCGKEEALVARLIRGPGLDICNECVTWFYERILTIDERATPEGKIGRMGGGPD